MRGGNERRDRDGSSRDALVESVVAHIASGSMRSIVFRGPAGIGKTYLAERVVDQLGDVVPARRVALRRVAGGAAQRTLDFGALLHLLNIDDPPVTAEFELVQRLRRGLVEQATRTILVLDDVGLLDVKSAAIIESLLRAGDVVALVTERTDDRGDRSESHPLAGALADFADAFIVPPLADEQLDRMITELAGPGEIGSIRRIASLSEGNPLAVRELVASAEAAGAVERRDGLWFLDSFSPTGSSLEYLVDSHLGRLSDPEWDLLRTVVIAGSVPRTVLARLDVDALERLERSGLVGGEPSEVLHPLYAEVIRSRLGGEESRRLCAKLASAVGPEDGADLARLGRWLLDSGASIDDTTARRGAATAIGRWENRLALELLAAIDEPTVADLVQSLWAHANDGDLDGATRLAAHAVAAAETDSERVDAGLAQAELWILQLGRSEEGYELLSELRASLIQPDQRARVDGATALYMRMTGRGPLAADITQAAIDAAATSDAARLPALLADAFGKLFVGQFDSVGPVVVEASELAERLREPHNAVRIAIVDALRHLLLGRLELADELVGRSLAAADVSSVRPAHAAWLGLAAHSAAMRGDFELARRRSREAVRAAEHVDDIGSGGFVRGEHRALRIELGVAIDPHPDESPVGRSRAEVRALPDDAPDVDERAARLVRSTVSAGYLLWAPWIGMEAVRRGPAPECSRLVAELAGGIDGDLYQTFVDHAVGGEESDVERIDRAAHALAAMGARSLELDARLTAIDAARRIGAEPVLMRRRVLGARVLLDAFAPQDLVRIRRRLARVSQAVEMPSERQLEIAALVAEGRSSKEVAAHLVVSARTVDNHLAAVYRMLGLASRAELGELF